MKTKDKLVVGFVWCLIVFEWFSLMYLFAPQLYQQNIFIFILVIPIFNVVVSILCISYYKATIYSPGTPTYIKNVHYQEELEDLKNYSRRETDLKKERRKNKKKGKIDLQEIKALNQVSFCFKCDVVKEERVHHCSVCRKCIMRMDHHCPWVGNCVGKFNHKYFILFLFYATTGLSTVAISITIDFCQGKSIINVLSETEQIWIAISCVTSYMLALSIGFLFVTQMITSCQNITTLQSFTDGVSDHNPWQRGSVVENLRQIFGDSNWMLPTQPFPDTVDSTGSNLEVVI